MKLHGGQGMLDMAILQSAKQYELQTGHGAMVKENIEDHTLHGRGM